MTLHEVNVLKGLIRNFYKKKIGSKTKCFITHDSSKDYVQLATDGASQCGVFSVKDCCQN